MGVVWILWGRNLWFLFGVGVFSQCGVVDDVFGGLGCGGGCDFWVCYNGVDIFFYWCWCGYMGDWLNGVVGI